MDFLCILEYNTPAREGEDQMWWVPKKKGEFDIRSYYKTLRGSSLNIFPWKGIWGVKVPRWVSFFVWIAAWEKILTSDNLRRRGFSIVDWCCMCRYSGETVDHLLIHCEKVNQLRCFVLRSFGISWVSPSDRSSFWMEELVGKHSSDIWNLIPLCLIWCIWRELNSHTFEDAES